jgi:hypothetical protein
MPQIRFFWGEGAPSLNISKRASDVDELCAQIIPKTPKHRRKLVEGLDR